MTTRPLPNILSDLRLTLEGRELKLHSVPWDEGMWSIGLEALKTPGDCSSISNRSADATMTPRRWSSITVARPTNTFVTCTTLRARRSHSPSGYGNGQPSTSITLFKDTWTRPTIAWSSKPTHPRSSASSRCVATSQHCHHFHP